MIIQCPKCQTKFSVSSELISELELPRFHCSRCDNVFDMDPRTPASFEEADIGSANPSSAWDPNDSTKTELEEVPIGDEIASLPEDADTEKYAEKNNSSTIEMNADDLKKVASAVNSEKEKSAKSLEIPKTYSPANPISAPIEKVEEELFTPFKSDPNLFETKTEQLSMDLQSDPLPERGNDVSMPYGVTYGDPLKNTADFQVAPEKPPVFEDMPLPSQGRNTAANFGIFLMPIILTLITAGLMSLYLIKSPSLAEAVAGNIGMSMPKFPPANMFIEKVKFTTVPLENGEIIYAISGKIRNDSQMKLKNVIIEGFAFDKSGKEIGSVKSTAGNGLNDTRIKSLNGEMIRAMQTVKAPKKYELNPNSSQDFMLVLQGASIGAAEFFSARIHSVIE